MAYPASYPLAVRRLASSPPRFLHAALTVQRSAVCFARCDQLTRGLSPPSQRPCRAHVRAGLRPATSGSSRRPELRKHGRLAPRSWPRSQAQGPRDDLYKLVKYLCRPSIAGERVTEQEDGRYRFELKTPWRDGTDAVFLSPADLTARMAALIALPGRPTIRSYGAFAPNAKLRPLVVQAGALAPRRRDKPQVPGHDCQVALTDAELALHVLSQSRQTSGRLAWSQAMKITWKIDTLQCPCGGRRSLVALIDQPPVIKKILRHLGLPTEAIIGGDVVYQVRGPPEDMVPEDLDETGTEIWPADDRDPGESVDDLPEGDWAA